MTESARAPSRRGLLPVWIPSIVSIVVSLSAICVYFLLQTKFHWPYSNTTDLVGFSGLVISTLGAMLAGLSLLGLVVTISSYGMARENQAELNSIVIFMRQEIERITKEERDRSKTLLEEAESLRRRIDHFQTQLDEWDKKGLESPAVLESRIENQIMRTVFGTYRPANDLKHEILEAVRLENLAGRSAGRKGA